MEVIRKQIESIEEEIRKKRAIIIESPFLDHKNRNVPTELSCLMDNLEDLRRDLVKEREKRQKELLLKIEDTNILIGRTKIQISSLKSVGNHEVAKKQQVYLNRLLEDLIDYKIDYMSIT